MMLFSLASIQAAIERIDYKTKTVILNFNQSLTLEDYDTYSWDLEQQNFNLKEYL